MNKKLNNHQIQFAISLHKEGAKKRQIGLIYSKVFGVNPTSIYRYLNTDNNKYCCYNFTYKEYNKSLKFWQELIKYEVQINNKCTDQLSAELNIPLSIVNKLYVDAIKTPPTGRKNFKSHVESCYNESKDRAVV